MKSIKKFFKIISTLFVSPKGTLSSKRATGFLMVSLAGYLIAIACLNNKEIQANNTTLIRDLIYGGVGLVGSTIFEKKFKNTEKNEN
jgi:hypothetical protein